MRLIKYTHAAVRLESDGRSVLLDPGIFTEDEAYDGVSHILVTHEHADHVSAEKLAAQLERNPALEVYTSAAWRRWAASTPRSTRGCRGAPTSASSWTACTTPVTRCMCPARRSRRCWCRPPPRGSSSPRGWTSCGRSNRSGPSRSTT